MENPTKEWLTEEIKGTLENCVLDHIISYMYEYRNNFSYLEIAEIFSQTIDEMAKKVAKELQEEDELEDEVEDE